MPTVSVIIPTHNRATLLERAIRSVLSQSYRDFEIIVIDDASIDNTRDMVETNFINEIKKGVVRYVKNEQSRERSFSRNRAMEMAKGKYIALLDDDDRWLPNHLEKLVNYLEEHKNIGCVFSNYAMIKGDILLGLGVKNLASYKGFSYRELCILGVLSQTSTSVFRKDIYNKIGGFREDLNLGENREFHSRIALNYSVHYIDISTCNQYVHEGSYSHLSSREYACVRERVWKLTEENSIKFNFPLRKRIIARAYIDIAWFFLPDVSKAREYLFKAIKKDPGILARLHTLRLLLRVIFGQIFYLALKKLRKRIGNKMVSFQRTNILQLIPDLGIGGAERMLLNLVRQLDKKKYNVLVCYWLGRGELGDKIKQSGIEVLDLGVRGGNLFKVTLKLTKLIKERQVQLLHTHLFDADLCGFFAARLAGVSTLISSIHSIFFLKKKKHAWRYRAMSLFIDRFLPVSESLTRHFISWAKIKPNKVTTVYNGIDLDEFNGEKDIAQLDNLRRSLRISSDEPVLGTVARLEPRKGLSYLLKAVSQIKKDYPNLKLIIVGEGKEKQYLVNLAKELDILADIIFLGSQEKITGLLSILDIFIMPSIEEGFGIAVLEAMSCGLPIVATKVGGIPELVWDGETGLLVPSKDSSLLAGAITRLLTDKKNAIALGEAGKLRAAQFSLKVMTEKIEEVYDCYIRRKSSRR